jgi:hypothetical protein
MDSRRNKRVKLDDVIKKGKDQRGSTIKVPLVSNIKFEDGHWTCELEGYPGYTNDPDTKIYHKK